MNTDRITTLQASLASLGSNDQSFASSLIDQFNRRGSLSDKQWPWVEKLIERATPKPVEEKKTVNLKPLQKLFETASEGLKKPRVAFSCSAGEFMVSRAADNSRNPGHLYVKDLGGTYLGKVDPCGRLHMSSYAGMEYEHVFEALEGFASNPAERAAAYGKETGNCCFCMKRLTDTRSVEVGYGPICADRWGLPWGA